MRRDMQLSTSQVVSRLVHIDTSYIGKVNGIHFWANSMTDLVGWHFDHHGWVLFVVSASDLGCSVGYQIITSSLLNVLLPQINHYGGSLYLHRNLISFENSKEVGVAVTLQDDPTSTAVVYSVKKIHRRWNVLSR